MVHLTFDKPVYPARRLTLLFKDCVMCSIHLLHAHLSRRKFGLITVHAELL